MQRRRGYSWRGTPAAVRPPRREFHPLLPQPLDRLEFFPPPPRQVRCAAREADPRGGHRAARHLGLMEEEPWARGVFDQASRGFDRLGLSSTNVSLDPIWAQPEITQSTEVSSASSWVPAKSGLCPTQA